MTQQRNQRPQGELLHQDKHRIPVNLTVIMSALVALFGVWEMAQGRNGLLLIVAGIGVGAYSWFTNPRQYFVFADALVVAYGAPRVKIIPFPDISRLDMMTLGIPDRLRVHFTNGKRLPIVVKDPEAFRDKLQEALDAYRAAHPESHAEGAPPPAA